MANLAAMLIGLERFDEAYQIIQEGLQRGLDSNGFHNRLYLIGFLKNDAALMAHLEATVAAKIAIANPKWK